MPDASINLNPGLYVTATPIGNLGDITYRAVQTLKAADLILCEDTRQTAKLCAAYGIKTPRSPYHDHNASQVRPDIIKKLQDGVAICLVSDAGTPLISDPGYKLVRDAREAGVNVIPIPGANAAITALCAAGLASDHFYFAGFLPPKAGTREKALGALRDVSATLIFYETGPRLSASLTAMTEQWGERQAMVARELTKLHEEFRAGSLGELAATYKEAPPKGEIVVLVEAAEKTAASEDEVSSFLLEALEELSVKEAATAAASKFGVARKTAYQLALKLKEMP